MNGSIPELSSVTSLLSELTKRVTALAELEAAARRDELANELYAVERTLSGAERRLARLIDAHR
jgi:hypothetical protein